MEVCAWPCESTRDEAQNCTEITGQDTFQQNLEGRVGRHLVDQGDNGIPVSENSLCTAAETGLVWEITSGLMLRERD